MAERAEAERKRAQVLEAADLMLRALLLWQSADELPEGSDRTIALVAARSEREIAIAAALA
jgi:hypothetical protein